MQKKTKETTAKIISTETNEILAEGKLKVDLIQPLLEERPPSFEAIFTVDSYMPELDGKVFMLELTPSLRGEAFIHIKGIPSKIRTVYKVIFQDSVWNNPDWFKGI